MTHQGYHEREPMEELVSEPMLGAEFDSMRNNLGRHQGYHERDPFDRCPDCGSLKVTCTEQERSEEIPEDQPGKHFHRFSCAACGWRSSVRIIA